MNIFQTWKTKTVPEKWKASQQSVINMNRNWNYYLLDDTNNLQIVKKYFPDFYQTFTSFEYPIQRADAIRYCVLYLWGGIYLDLDYICNKPFDDILLQNKFEVGLIKSNNVEQFTNSFLMSKPKSYFWLLCIEQMKNPLPLYKKITKHFEIFNSTGPFMINKMANENKKYIQVLHNISVPCNICELSSCAIDSTYYLTPIDGSSWHSWDSTLLNYIYCLFI